MFRSRFDAMKRDVNVLHGGKFCTRACSIAETIFSFPLPVTIDYAIMEQCRQERQMRQIIFGKDSTYP